MKNFLVVTLIILSLALLALPVAAITWGEPDTDHHNVGAMMLDFPDYGVVPGCSGTLIHPRIFLTAGHCTEGVEPEEVWVNFNPDGLDTSTNLDVAEVVTHPDYYWGPRSNPHDLGALILAEPVTDIEPANLAPLGFLDDLKAQGLLKNRGEKAKFTMVGYGATLYFPPPDIVYEDQRQFALSEYRALLKSWLRVSQNQATGDGGTCYGDSGGPAFWTEPSGKEILVGVTSWGDAPCVAAGFYYRVDIPETLDFIDDLIAGLD